MAEGDVQRRSSPITAISAAGIPRCVSIAFTAAREGLPTIVGRLPLALAMAAVTMAPRLKIGPFAPA